MKAVIISVLLSLVGLTVAQQCATRPPPSFDCRNVPEGVFFPHPNDCTFLVLCMYGQDIVLSLCNERQNGAVYEIDYSLGCPAKCPLVEPNCNWTKPPVPTTPPPPPTNPSTKCSRSGIFEDARDCKKALICSSVGAEVIMYDICRNIGVDSSFPVGCPKKCPNWLPNVVAENFVVGGP